MNYFNFAVTLLLTPTEAIALIAALAAIGVPWVVIVALILMWFFKKEDNK
jgi:hypothetical protein